MKNDFKDIVKDICDKNDIEFKLLSRDWIIMLRKDDKIKFISGYKFPLNDHALGEILDDKYGLYYVLNELGIPVAEHNILYDSSNNNEYAIGYNDRNLIYDYFKDNNNSIVLKTNVGTCGHNVYRINNFNDIDPTLDSLFSKYNSISYCPCYTIKNEYRVIVLNKKIKIIYKKIKPIVVGNGKDTIKDLLLKFNYQYFNNKLDSDEFERVLDKDETYEYDWKFNLSKGAVANFEIDKTVLKELKKIVKKILNNVDLGFASIDIIEMGSKFLVLEINSGVMTKNLVNIIKDPNIIKSMYEEAILTMFQE